MQIKTGTPQQFQSGAFARSRELGTHTYTAHLDGKRIVVNDAHGEKVHVTYGGTSDNRTGYAVVEGVGIIGGWTYPHRAMPWRYMVRAINRHVLYPSTDALPKRSTLKAVTCPHCGEVFEA